MTNQLDLSGYKQEIAAMYDRRSSTYDNSEQLIKICDRLMENAQISPGQNVLDIATGTGHLAISVAEIVKAKGKVVGVDIAAKMLNKAQEKADKLSLTNIKFKLADAELLVFPANSFERILCANSFPFIENRASTLRLWQGFLKPNGLIAIHTPADTSYIGNTLARQVFKKYGVAFGYDKPINTVTECRDLLSDAGFEAIEIKTEQHGNYINLDDAKKMWNTISSLIPKQTMNLRSRLTSAQLIQAGTEFETELNKIATSSGIWNDITTFYILARKKS
jgi:ubiquinone/menaquinone biosynthesis C-methylase UbiE